MKFIIHHAPLIKAHKPSHIRSVRVNNNEYAPYREVATVEADYEVDVWRLIVKDRAKYGVTKTGLTLVEACR